MNLNCFKQKKMSLRRLALIAIFVIAAMGFVSNSVASEGKRGGNFKVSLATDVTQLDMHQTSAEIDTYVMGYVFENLFTYDGKFNIKPFLVTSYAFSDDNLALTLDLRKGVKFHNGDEMTAEDVVFSLNRAKDPELPAFHAKDLKGIKAITATGKYQVKLEMSEVIPNLLYYLTTGIGPVSIMNKKALEASGNKVDHPIGTGPYKFKTWQRDNKVVLERFEEYSSLEGPVDGFLGKRNNYFDSITFLVMNEPSTRIMGLGRGDVDLISTLPYNQIDELKKRTDMKIMHGLPPSAVWYLFYMNMNDAVLSDINLRQAMAYALDRSEIAKAAVWGYGTPSASIISPKLPAYTPELEKMAHSYDLEKAKEYLKKSNYNGQKIKILTSKAYTPMFDQCVAAQAMWAAAGINTEIEIVDWATHLAKWKKGEHQILSFAMFGRMNSLAQTWVLGKTNFYGYKNQKMFDLRDAMAKTADPDEQNRLFQEMYKLTIKDVPFIINFYIDNSYAFKPYVKGFEEYDIFALRYWNMYFDK